MQKQFWPVMNLLAFFLLFLLTFTINNVSAQQRVITGKIVSKNGEGLPGANVSVKGTTNGILSDANGNFSISAAPTDVLTITYVGYVSQEIPVNAQSELQVTLVEEATKINEVVITALGIKKDIKSIGYASEVVSGSDLTKARDANTINGLVGKVAGLAVGASSEFLGTPQLVLRGNTDILYVVDGVPINSDTWNISADDIESYTVLKGPNAGALYGSRGVNGAILITTKKGSGVKGTSTVEFNSSDIIDPKSFIAIPVRQNEYGIGTNYQYAFTADPYNNFTKSTYGRVPVWGPALDGEGVAQYNSPVINGVRQKTPFLPLGKNNFINFMEAGFHTTNSLCLTASGDKYDMRISFTDVYQKGIDPNTWLNSPNGNLYAGYNFTKRIRFEGNVNFNYQYSPNVPDAIYGPNSYTYMIQEYGGAQFDVTQFKNYWQSPKLTNVPSAGIPGIQQYWVEYGRANNPYFMAYQWLHAHQKTDVYGYAKVVLDLLPELKLTIRTQVSTYSLFRSEILPTSAITYDPNGAGIVESVAKTGEYREDHRNMWDNNNDVLLTYNKNVTPDIFVSTLAGANIRSFTYTSSWISTNNMVVPSVYNFANTLNPLVAYNFKSNMNVYSLYYSVDFAYKKYFTISTTGRNDISSVFVSAYSSYFYPSVSASSVLTDYIKMPASIISYLKLRASYANVKGGLTSPTIGPSFEPLAQPSPLGYGSSYYSSYGGPTYNNQNGYNISHVFNNLPAANYNSTIANSSLKPYTVSSVEFGGDIRFLNNKIGLGATYFHTTNGPQIFPEQVPPSTGFSAVNINGITTNKNGVELELTLNPITNLSGWSWVLTANYSTYKETLKSIYSNQKQLNINSHNYNIGDRLDAMYGYKYYRDPQGDIINDGTGNPMQRNIQDINHEQFLGYTNPDYIWSIINKISFKGITLGFQFDGRVGGVIYDEIYGDMMNSGNATDLNTGAMGVARAAEWNDVNSQGSTPGEYVGPGVVISNGTATYDKYGNIDNFKDLTFSPNTKKVGLKGYVSQNYTGGTQIQEAAMVSKTYGMLREITLTYNVPDKILAKNRVFKKASISLVGRNLLYFTVAKRQDTDLDQYPAGFDFSRLLQQRDQLDQSNGYNTENLSLSQSATMQTPITRQFGFNINLVF